MNKNLQELIKKQNKAIDKFLDRKSFEDEDIRNFLCQFRKEIIKICLRETVGEETKFEKNDDGSISNEWSNGYDEGIADGYNNRVKEAKLKAKEILKEL